MHKLADADLIWQQCLFAFEEPSIDANVRHRDAHVARRRFVDRPRPTLAARGRPDLRRTDRGAAVAATRGHDVRPAAAGASADGVVEHVVARSSRSCRCWPMLVTRSRRHYARPFDSIGFNLYRDGHDSVAWHSDRERYELEDPTVAIVSTGQPRPFHVRPRGGGASRSWQLGHGDLFVMGGSCQHDWEHCVPKVAAAGPRLSIMFRHNLAEAEVRD